MISNWHKLPVFLALAVYVAVVALIAIFYEFPYDAAVRVVQNRIEISAPIRLQLSPPKPETPFSLSLNKLNIATAAPLETLWLFKSSQAKVILRPTRLLGGRISGRIEAAAWDGRIKGTFEYQLYGPKKFCLTLTEIDFPNFSLTDGNESFMLTGKLQGQSAICGQNETILQSGSGVIKIESGRFSGRPIPNSPKVEVDFELLELYFSVEKDKIVIKGLNIKSPATNLKLNGLIQNLKNPFLALTGSVNLGPANQPKTRINFNLTGPADNPRLRFGPAAPIRTRK